MVATVFIGIQVLEFMTQEPLEDTYASTMKALWEAMNNSMGSYRQVWLLLMCQHPNHKLLSENPTLWRLAIHPTVQTGSLSFLLLLEPEKYLHGQQLPDEAIKDAETGFLQQQDVSFHSEGI